MGVKFAMKDLFYKPVKIKRLEHEVLFWSDMHIGHDPKWENPLWKTRGFDSVEEHDETLIQRWNAKATANTVGFHLGDIIFGHNAEQRLRVLFERLNFECLFVLCGNHVAGWKQVFESCEENIYRVNENKQVVFTPNYLEAYVNGQAMVMCHYPIVSWNGIKTSYALHGHVHGSLKEEVKGRSLCMDVESQPHPLNFNEIRAIMRKKEFVGVDHHGEPGNSSPFS